MLRIGARAPDFDLEASTGERQTSRDLRGRFAVIIFYPKNDTPGWNHQLSDLEGRRPEFEALNCRVLAVNPASVADHKRFAVVRGLRFPILSDPGGRTAKVFQARVPVLGLTVRTVYALGPDGEVVFARRGQADLKEVLEAIRTRS